MNPFFTFFSAILFPIKSTVASAVFFLFEAGVLENLVFHKSTLQTLQIWLKTLWELIFGIVANLQPMIL